MKMYKDPSAKYYQDNNERLQKRALSIEEREKSNNMIVKDIKIYQKMKNKSWLSIEKIMTK